MTIHRINKLNEAQPKKEQPFINDKNLTAEEKNAEKTINKAKSILYDIEFSPKTGERRAIQYIRAEFIGNADVSTSSKQAEFYRTHIDSYQKWVNDILIQKPNFANELYKFCYSYIFRRYMRDKNIDTGEVSTNPELAASIVSMDETTQKQIKFVFGIHIAGETVRAIKTLEDTLMLMLSAACEGRVGSGTAKDKHKPEDGKDGQDPNGGNEAEKDGAPDGKKEEDEVQYRMELPMTKREFLSSSHIKDRKEDCQEKGDAYRDGQQRIWVLYDPTNRDKKDAFIFIEQVKFLGDAAKADDKSYTGIPTNTSIGVISKLRDGLIGDLRHFFLQPGDYFDIIEEVPELDASGNEVQVQKTDASGYPIVADAKGTEYSQTTNSNGATIYLNKKGNAVTLDPKDLSPVMTKSTKKVATEDNGTLFKKRLYLGMTSPGVAARDKNNTALTGMEATDMWFADCWRNVTSNLNNPHSRVAIESYYLIEEYGSSLTPQHIQLANISLSDPKRNQYTQIKTYVINSIYKNHYKKIWSEVVQAYNNDPTLKPQNPKGSDVQTQAMLSTVDNEIGVREDDLVAGNKFTSYTTVDGKKCRFDWVVEKASGNDIYLRLKTVWSDNKIIASDKMGFLTKKKFGDAFTDAQVFSRNDVIGPGSAFTLTKIY